VTSWGATLGAVANPAGGTSFRVWAPTTRSVDLVLDVAGKAPEHRALTRDENGMFTGTFGDVTEGARYRYLLDGDGPFPDPASRCQPDGVHGASLVVDPSRFVWTDRPWAGVPLDTLVVYELHVGTFAPSGTFEGVAERLASLRHLGVTAVELMPVSDFPGRRNWGYDGAAPFAPSRCYGAPDDLRKLVDTAHRVGLAVLLDVVYNHMGPDGAYLSRYSPYYFTDRHESPWGAGIDLDGEHSSHVREFFIENALHWIHEYHLDGLRLDATHAIQDASARHFLAELAARVHGSVTDRQVHVTAEDHRNLAVMVRPEDEFGWGLDAVWADDLHHQVRRHLAGDADGYYQDYSGSTPDLATTVRQGWFYIGQRSEHLGAPRGTDPTGLHPSKFIVCIQNHDQVGNRAFGERLHHQIAPAAYRAVSALLLMLPQTPLLFMGQEWAASTPFLYFTDHEPTLGRLVTEGRRREFRSFAAFSDEAASAIPDPQAASTFAASRLDWSERNREPHAAMLRLYQTLLVFRHIELLPGEAADALTAEAIDDETVVFGRTGVRGDRILVVTRLGGAGVVDLRGRTLARGWTRWTLVLTSEAAEFAEAPAPPQVDCAAAPVIRFAGPAAVILRGTLARPSINVAALEETSRTGPLPA
jgi:maltooligosyltrehalose trehalohydrolase